MSDSLEEEYEKLQAEEIISWDSYNSAVSLFHQGKTVHTDVEVAYESWEAVSFALRNLHKRLFEGVAD